MRKSRHTEERIIKALNEVEAGAKLQDVTRKLGITEATFYRWKSKYGGLEVSDVKRLKGLEDENRKLKTLVADLTLDKQALEHLLGKKW
jgi:putative transposase